MDGARARSTPMAICPALTPPLRVEQGPNRLLIQSRFRTGLELPSTQIHEGGNRVIRMQTSGEDICHTSAAHFCSRGSWLEAFISVKLPVPPIVSAKLYRDKVQQCNDFVG